MMVYRAVYSLNGMSSDLEITGAYLNADLPGKILSGFRSYEMLSSRKVVVT